MTKNEITKNPKNKINTKAKSKPEAENNCQTIRASAHKKALRTLSNMTKVDVF